MKSATIDGVILELCGMIASDILPLDWTDLPEERFLFEAAVCILGSQMQYEMALATAQQLSDDSIFSLHSPADSCLEERILSAMSHPVDFEVDGRPRQSYPRFKNRMSSMLASTIDAVSEGEWTFRGVLASAESAHSARTELVDKVSGFGPKQASLFLRRVGFTSELAVLDVHILDYLQNYAGVAITRSSLSSLPAYERVERDFRRVAEGFGHPPGCVDLAMWITMRVAKRTDYR